MRYRELTAKEPLNEGVRFGKRELNATLADIDEFVMGVEYEFHANNPSRGNDVTYVREKIKEFGISNIADVVSEHDQMTEVITERMGIIDGLEHIKKFFHMAESNGMTFPNTAGMHVSISTKGNVDRVNKVKFLVLMAGGYLNKIFPKRQHTSNMEDVIVSSLKHFKPTSDIKENIVSSLESYLDRYSEVMYTKYNSINMTDYHEHDGRIELRFFGGEDYNKRYDELRWNIIRSCFILGISYSDTYDKEYRKSLMALFSKSQERESKSLLSFFRSQLDDPRSMLMVSTTDFFRYIRSIRNRPMVLKKELNAISTLVNKTNSLLVITLMNSLLNYAPDEAGVFSFISKHITLPEIDTTDLSTMFQYVATSDMKDQYTEIFKKRYIDLVVNHGDVQRRKLDKAFGEIPEIIDRMFKDVSISKMLRHVFLSSSGFGEYSLGYITDAINKEGFEKNDEVGQFFNRLAKNYDGGVDINTERLFKFLFSELNGDPLSVLVDVLSKNTTMIPILFSSKSTLKNRLPSENYITLLQRVLVMTYGTMETNDREEAEIYYQDSESILKELVSLASPPRPFDDPVIKEKLDLFIEFGINIDRDILERYKSI